MFAVVFLDVPIARQVIGFVYASFVPGFLLLGILRLNTNSTTNAVLLSVGLSLSLLTFTGLVTNELYPTLGIADPLSANPLLITIGSILLIMTWVHQKFGTKEFLCTLPSLRQVTRILPLTGIVLLAVFGASFASSTILLLFVIAIIILVPVTIFSRRLVSSELYPIVILLIALSFLFHSEFISNHLQGFDVLGEFYVFKLTYNNSIWNSAIIPAASGAIVDYNGMLSVTILPTVLSRLLNIRGEMIFKYGYLLFYSLVPISIYQIYKHGFGKPIAFLSAFYFILFPRFYSEERRQIIGELFLILSILVIMDKTISTQKKTILLCIFGATLVVSHYSLSYIFLFSILSALAFLFVTKKFAPTTLKITKESSIKISFVLILIIITVLWYFFVAPAEGQTVLSFAGHVVTSFTNSFSSVESRGGTVSEFVAPNLTSMSLLDQIDYLINKIPYFLIIIGFIATVRNYKKLKLRIEYLPMAAAALCILLMVLALPAFAPAFLAHRFYHVSLLFLTPICIYGGVTLLRWLLKPLIGKKRAVSVGLSIVCILMLTILLFKVGFISEVTGNVPISSSINLVRMKNSDFPNVKGGFYESYIPVQEVQSADWLRYATESSKIYADETGAMHVLRAYGMKNIEWKYFLSNQTIIQPRAYVYLRYLNVQGWFKDGERFSNFTVISNQLDFTNKIYSNSDSEIYYSLPIQ